MTFQNNNQFVLYDGLSACNGEEVDSSIFSSSDTWRSRSREITLDLREMVLSLENSSADLDDFDEIDPVMIRVTTVDSSGMTNVLFFKLF